MDPNCLVTLLLYPKLFYDVDVDDMKMDGEKIGRCLFWFRLFLCVFYTACQESQKEFQHKLVIVWKCRTTAPVKTGRDRDHPTRRKLHLYQRKDKGCKETSVTDVIQLQMARNDIGKYFDT